MPRGVVGWPDEFARRYRARGYWAGVPIGDAFDRSVAAHADREAVVDGDRRLGYRELGRLVDRLARHLAVRGIAGGAPVGLHTPDGFYRTGDLVRRHPSGNLVVEGRKKDLINRGGEKISAEEVENLILSHPAVANAAVVAMPDPVLGERACAFAVLRPGASRSLAELVAFLEAKRIARFKLPERLEVVERFPTTAVGKISKKDLREEATRRLTRGGPGA